MLRKIVRRLRGSQRPAAPARHEYKTVWNALAGTESSAKRHVGGSEREEDLRNTGVVTRDVLSRTVGIRPEDTFLEIGCGVGRVGQMLAPLVKQWIGCDVSPNMIAHARTRLQAFGNVRFVEISGYDLTPIPNASVDVVYCTVVLMHLDEWDRYNYVLEARRILRPGGRVFIDNFSICSDEGWAVFETHRTQVAPHDRAPHMSKSSTPQELETYLRRAGFEQVQGIAEGQMIHYWGIKPTNP